MDQIYLLRVTYGKEDLSRFDVVINPSLGQFFRHDHRVVSQIPYQFKVVGEPVVLMVCQTKDTMAIEILWHRLLLTTDIVCEPLCSYETFASRFGVVESLTSCQPKLTAKHCLWVEVTFEYSGKTFVDFLELWIAEAEAALTSRKTQFAAFKVCGQRKVQFFTSSSAEEFDAALMSVPMTKENGKNMKMTIKSVVNVQFFTSSSAEEFDAALMSVPMTKENGKNMKMTIKSVVNVLLYDF